MDRLFTSSITNYYKASEQCFNPSKYSEGCYTDLFNLPPTYPKSHTNSKQCNSFMDDEDLSFKQFLPFKEMFNSNQVERPNTTTNQFMRPSSSRSEFSELNLSEFGAESGSNGRWASNLLMECARAIAQKETGRMQHLLWMLNEMSSPYGDYEQKLASYFLQALFCKITDTGSRCYRTLCSAVEKTYSFDSARKMILKYQESSPWTTFGHVAANGAILEALEGEMKLHIIDMSNTFCTQWPTLLEALATRSDETPHLRLTSVVTSKEAAAIKVMKEIGHRMEKFARLMGVPFEFSVVHHHHLQRFDLETVRIRPDEALAINCIHSLQRVSNPGRDSILSTFQCMNPKIVTVVEDEMDLTSDDFLDCFSECLRFFSLFFESLEESFSRTSNERLMLERTSARSMVNILACEDSDVCERREKAVQWASRLRDAGFVPATFSDDVVDDVRALLKRYKEGWAHCGNSDGIFLTWKEQCVIWASAWKPCL
ncbi:protein SHORT-ROOT [Cryptomeria japonica]|uniref:protein SHORT-ROOT n=1 Tax=Cryptomeria japonica TaxID=3369 RepID=UPI0025AB7DE8|nr:protein SHORT-ROOT [Cryptomeria japonica]